MTDSLDSTTPDVDAELVEVVPDTAAAEASAAQALADAEAAIAAAAAATAQAEQAAPAAEDTQRLTFTAVTDLVYATADKTCINATVTFDGLGALPFTLSPTDTETHAVQLYAEVLAGTHGAIADYVPAVISAAQLEADARAWRDTQITDSQWLIERHRDQTDAGSATTLKAAQYTALLVYRQALRDWPTVAGFPADASRPVAPEWLPAAEAEALLTA